MRTVPLRDISYVDESYKGGVKPDMQCETFIHACLAIVARYPVASGEMCMAKGDGQNGSDHCHHSCGGPSGSPYET